MSEETTYYKIANDAGEVVEIQLPRPIGWKVLIRPKQPKKVSSGGIVLVDEAQDAESAMTYVGQVLAIGEAAFTARTQGGVELSGFEVKPKVGDWVIYAPFAGQKMRVKGDDSIIILMNDTELQAMCPNPEDYWSWIDV